MVRRAVDPGRWNTGTVHETDLMAASPRADQPAAPIESGDRGAVPSSHLGGIGLDLMLADLGPDDQPHIGRHLMPAFQAMFCRTSML